MRVFIAVLFLIFSLQSWSKADDIQDFWIVFKVQKDATNADDLKKPDYIVMNGFKDEEQRTKQTMARGKGR